MKKKKILFFIPRMGGGGAERVIATLANGLVNKNYDVLILSLMDDESYYDLDDKVKIIGANIKVSKKNKLARSASLLLNMMQAYSFYNSQVKKFKPNIVVSFLLHTNLIAIITKIFNKNIKLIVSERNDPTVPNFLMRSLVKKMYKKSDLLVVQSTFVKNYFNNIKDSKIAIIENPLNNESLPLELANVREKKIVGVGRLFKQKNFDLLIKSFSDISSEFPEYTLEIYGEGPLRNDLQSLINTLNLEKKAFLMGDKKNVMKLISNSEIFVMASDYEGFPNALVEAMASGLPVISTDFSTGVAKELVSESNGIVIPVGDRNSLANAMVTMLNEPENRNIMGENNWKIREKLNDTKIIEKWEDSLNTIIQR